MSADKTRPYNMDRERVTGATRVIMSDHGNIHAGEGFNAWVFAEGVADDAYNQIEFITGSSHYVHLKSIMAFAEGLGSLEVIEAPTLTTGSTPFVPQNLNCSDTPPVSESILKINPTSISAGTVKRAYLIGAGKENGGPTNLDTEIVLKQSTTYLIRVRNLGGAAKALSLWLFWYEEDGA